MRINEDSVEAIKNMPPPKDKTTLQSFLGMVNYMKRYSKELTKLTPFDSSLNRTQFSGGQLSNRGHSNC
jgi:hypothetical protein